MSILNGTSFSDEFDPKGFLNTFCVSPTEIPDSAFAFCRQRLYNFYSRYGSKWDKNTARLLEFGGGPTLQNLISAVPYINEITFAAHTESERKEIELWKNEKEGAHDWSSHFKYIVNEVENIAGDDAWREREELLRKRISSVVPCDISWDNPLPIEHEPFEIVFTSLCLESACKTYTEYKVAIKKLVSLLKPGGFLLVIMAERETFYVDGKRKWSTLYNTFEQAKEAVAEAGTTIYMAEREPASMEYIQNPVIADGKGFAFLAAQKVVF